jgi:hypothetical protein
MTRPAAWLAKKVPFMFTATVRSKSGSVTCSAAFLGPRPALFTRMSRCPNRSVTAWTDRPTWSRSVTSIWRGSAVLPSASTSPAMSPAPPASRSPRATSAPAAARATAMARPRPRPAPVTKATRPSRSNRGSSSGMRAPVWRMARGPSEPSRAVAQSSQRVAAAPYGCLRAA